ncbi:hypothetical protein [Zhengella mangrovi]|nr:hypothetical protein [Zhengella mangrovi]
MSEQQPGDGGEAATAANMRKLSDVLRVVKSDMADRDDVVVELREAQKMRLDLLVQELKPLIDEIPASHDQFDLALSSGEQPRFWVDATSHVTMGRDKRTYRFLKDTRLGRVVLGETADVKPMADQVARYIGERIVERERAMEGEVAPVARPSEAMSTKDEKAVRPVRESSFWEGFMLFLIGTFAGIGLTIALLWDRLHALGLDFWNRAG